ncbi:hypothetical protein LI328DRAFT_136491 [Trichoderma asperelloides]|nr:hypothetical protein LI328DRAFT_136491 [Trichoderma asperelloides]
MYLISFFFGIFSLSLFFYFLSSSITASSVEQHWMIPYPQAILVPSLPSGHMTRSLRIHGVMAQRKRRQGPDERREKRSSAKEEQTRPSPANSQIAGKKGP